MKRWVLWLALVLTGCTAGPGAPSGQAPSHARSEPPTATPGPAPAGLLVVLEARGPGSTFGGGPDAYDAHDVVAIAGTDGFAKAKQHFKPRAIPFIGNAGTIMQPEARAADGAVFYVDGGGVVRRLDVNGTVTQVTSFPFGQPQQELSFAVSPDSKHLMASVLTLPARNPNAQTPVDPPFVAGSHAFLEIFAADAGGQARSLSRTDLGTSPGNWMRVVGWDRSGPLVTLQTGLGTQQGSLGNWLGGTQLAHLDSAGRPGSAITPAACLPWQLLDDGRILCSDPYYRVVTLIASGGAIVARFPDVPGPFLALSPDESWLAFHGGAETRNGEHVALPDRFFPQGWLDANTIIGYQDASGIGATVGNMALVRISDPSHIDDLGFTGVLAGVL